MEKEKEMRIRGRRRDPNRTSFEVLAKKTQTEPLFLKRGSCQKEKEKESHTPCFSFLVVTRECASLYKLATFARA